MNHYIQILIAASIATCPSIFIKKYIKIEDYKLLILALICYIILIYMYINIYKKLDISRAYIIILTLQILFVSLIAIFYYKEEVTKYKIIGIIGAIISIYFLTKKC